MSSTFASTVHGTMPAARPASRARVASLPGFAALDPVLASRPCCRVDDGRTGASGGDSELRAVCAKMQPVQSGHLLALILRTFTSVTDRLPVAGQVGKAVRPATLALSS